MGRSTVFAGNPDILTNREPRVRHGLLKGSYQSSPCDLIGGSASDVLTLPEDGPSRGFVNTRDDVEQSSLARAVWSNDADYFVQLDGEIYSGQGYHAAKCLAQASNLKSCHPSPFSEVSALRATTDKPRRARH